MGKGSARQLKRFKSSIDAEISLGRPSCYLFTVVYKAEESYFVLCNAVLFNACSRVCLHQPVEFPHHWQFVFPYVA